MVAQASRLSTQEIKAGESGVQGYSLLQSSRPAWSLRLCKRMKGGGYREKNYLNLLIH